MSNENPIDQTTIDGDSAKENASSANDVEMVRN